MRCQQEELTKEISAMLEHLNMKAIRKKYVNMQEKVSMIALLVLLLSVIFFIDFYPSKKFICKCLTNGKSQDEIFRLKPEM